MGRGQGAEEILFGGESFRRQACELAPSEELLAEKTIRKTYSYRDEEGDVHGDLDLCFDEFADSHIQDRGVAYHVALRLLRDGESENSDEHEGIWQRYEPLDRERLRAQLRAIVAADEGERELAAGGVGLTELLGL